MAVFDQFVHVHRHAPIEDGVELVPVPLTPEQHARERIDEYLDACGWVIQDFRVFMDIHAELAVTAREFPLEWQEGAKARSVSADYLLYSEGRAMGVIEAKPYGHTLEGVFVQLKRYTEGLDEQVPAWCRPLPCAYEATQFTDGLDPHRRLREISLSTAPRSCSGSSA